MSDFEEYIKVNYPRDYERQKRIYPDQNVEELYSEDHKMWQHQQAIIDDLKAQLNNMEACYIEKKKQVEDQLNQTKGACGRYDRLYEEYRLLELLVGNYRVLAQEVLPRCSRELLENIEGWEKALRGES